MWEGYERDPEIAGAAVEWLRTKGVGTNGAGKSFFLAVNLINPHDVMFYNTDEDFQGMVEVGGAPDAEVYRKSYDVELPPSWNQDLRDGTLPAAIAAYKARWERQTGSVTTEEGWKDFRDYYFNCIQDSDDNLMNILQSLVSLGLLDNTIVVFTADHGELAGTHGLKGKAGVMYEENIHVPLVICHPEHEGGKSVSAVTSHIDLATTFVHMTNIPEGRKRDIIGKLPGRNLMNLVDGTSTCVREGALFCFEMISMTMAQASLDQDGNPFYTFDTGARGFIRGVVSERYKFARYFSSDFNMPVTLPELLERNDIELYDLEKDPLEMNNLASEPESNAALIMKMNALLNGLIAREIGRDDGTEFTAAIEAYTGTPPPGPEEEAPGETASSTSGGCSGGAGSAAGLFLVLPLLVLAPLVSRKAG